MVVVRMWWVLLWLFRVNWLGVIDFSSVVIDVDCVLCVVRLWCILIILVM